MNETEVALKIILEMLMSPIERSLVESLKENPYEQSTRNAYIDYLKEKGRDIAAKLVEEYDYPHYYQNKNLKLPSSLENIVQPISGLVSGFVTTVYDPNNLLTSGHLGVVDIPSGSLGLPTPYPVLANSGYAEFPIASGAITSQGIVINSADIFSGRISVDWFPKKDK